MFYSTQWATRSSQLITCMVRLCVHLPRVGILSKRMDGSSWFLAQRFRSTYPTLCCEEIYVLGKSTHNFPRRLCPKLWTYIFHRDAMIQFDCYNLYVDNLARQRWMLSKINWNVTHELSWQRVQQLTANLSHRLPTFVLSMMPSCRLFCDS